MDTQACGGSRAEADTRSERSHRRRSRWARAALVGGALVGLGALSASRPSAEAAETRDFQIGAVDTDAGQSIGWKDRTFWVVQDAFDEQTDPAQLTRIPIDVLGPLPVTVNDATVEIDEETTSVTFRGSSPDFMTATPSEPADVLVLFDWAGGSEDKPSVVVSGRLPGGTLGGVLGDAGGLTGAALDERMYTVGSSELEPRDLEHISRPANVPPLAAVYYEEVYGSPLPGPNVPALTSLNGSLFLSIGVDLSEVPDVAADAFGWEDGDHALFEGGLGIGLGQQFDPTTATWSLGATLPGSPSASTLVPGYLDFANDARWRAAIAYDAGAGKVTLTANVNASTDLLGGSQIITLQASLAFETADPSLATVSVLADVSGDWPAPFGIDWIDVNRVKITGEFGRTVPEGGTDPQTTASFSVEGFSTVAGKEVKVTIEGQLDGSEPSGSIELRMDDTVTSAELIDVLDDAGALGLPDLPDTVIDAALSDVVIRVDFGTRTTGTPPTSQRVVTVTFGGNLTLHLPLPGNGINIDATLLASVGTDRNVMVGVRSNTDLDLSDLLPGVDVPIDFPLARADGTSSFGFMFTTMAVNQPINDLPLEARRFLRPLSGFEASDTTPFDVELPAGASLLGSFEMPEQLTEIVDRLGWQSRMLAHGTLPIFDMTTGVRLELEVVLQSEELLPDFVHQVQGDIVITGASGPPPTIKVAFVGELDLRIRSGLPSEVAEPLNAAGIPVGIDKPVTSDADCRTGRALPEKRTDPDELHCYDILRLNGEFGIEAKADGSVELSITAKVSTPGAGNVWYPFGLTWLGLDDLRIMASIEAGAAGTVDFELGMVGDVEALGGNQDVLAAIQMSLKLLVEPPWVMVELDGIRVASGSGFDTGDLLDLQHLVADAAGAGGTRFDLSELGLPDFALRNVDVAFSPKGVPTLCMPQGLTLSADLYINPSADAPRVNPSCQNQQLIIPDEEDRCINRRTDGCIASGRLRVSFTGIFGLFQIPGFDVGPIHLDDLNIDLAVAVQDSHLVGEGGGRIDNPLDVGPDTLADGRVRVKFQPTTFSIFGELDALGFRALVDTTASYSVLQDPVPEFQLHVLLATDRYHIGEPSFVSAATRELQRVLMPLATVADVADVAIDVTTSGRPLSELTRLTDAMSDIGMDVPPELAAFNSEAAEYVSEFEDAIDFVGGSVFDLAMNGIPSFETPEVCVDVGFDEVCVGGWGFGGTAGLCDEIFPAGQFPDLRDSDGDCTLDRLVDGVILPVFEESMGALIDVTGLDLRALIEALANLDLTKSLLQLECAELFVDIGPDAAVSEAALVGNVFGIGFGFHLGFDFADPVGSIDDFVQSVVEQLVNPTSVDCIGLNEDLFTATPDVGDPELLLTIDAPDVIDEGAPLSLAGSFGAPLPADRTVDIDWGDGTVEQITVAIGQTGFTLDHTYVDDDPSATSSDVVEIVATDLSSGAGGEAPRQDAEQVTVRNVAPSIVSVTPARAVEEGRAQTFTLTLDDPGLADTHRVWVEWGDQTMSSAAVAPGERTVTLNHTYRDDNPTRTPVDTYDVVAHATDDDLGRVTGRFPQQVRNVAPSGLRLELQSENVVEGAPVEFRVSWNDPGVFDTHTVHFNWADGAGVVRTNVVRGLRSLVVSHTWGDNGTYDVVAQVVDDDTGREAVTIPVTVDNVDPTVAIDRSPTFAAPGGDTFLVRVDTPLEVGADLTDPGSDDETFTWAWGDGLTDVTVDRVNPPADDPLPSPSIQPRDIRTSAVHEYDLSCLYWLDLGVEDDDSGTAADRAPVVAVGDESDARPRGWWYEEYLHFDGGSPSTKVDDRTKACHLLVADHMSSVFGEIVPLATPQDAVAVLHPDGMSTVAKFDRELLAAWLNYAGGAVGSDEGGQIQPGFAEVVYAAEQVRLDPTSTDRDLHDAIKALSDAQDDDAR